MSNIRSFPNNQDEYIGAEDVMRWFHGRTSGVFGAEENAAVAPVIDSMAVTVSDGTGWLSNDKANGIVWWNDTEEKDGSKLQLPVDMADAALDRIDRVIVSWNTTNYIDLPEVKILKGTPSSSPVAPSLTNDSIVRQISLAKITIPAGATAITDAMITDERLDSSVCGLVTESVEIDTTVSQRQFNEMLKQVATELSRLNLGDEHMLKSLYDPDCDGLIDISVIKGLADALTDFVSNNDKGVAGGVASLDDDGKIPESQLPTINVGEVYTAAIGTTWALDENTGVRSQSVSIPGVLARHTAKIDHAYNGNGTVSGYANFVEAENQYLNYITNGYAETYDGGITFYIFGEANTVGIPIVVEVV